MSRPAPQPTDPLELLTPRERQRLEAELIGCDDPMAIYDLAEAWLAAESDQC